MSEFIDFNLDEKILKILQEIGYKKPTSIQELAIPKVLEGLDIVASAQTGTGKTAAFMLPALNLIASLPRQKGIAPKMLILVPTRELAMQVATESEKYSKYLPQIKTVCVFGGVPYPIQKRALSRPFDILVATPGRLIDHLQQGRLDLSQVKILVLDEADRMLDMGFIEAVEQIADEIPEERQTLLFSATLDSKILNISRKLQRNPCEVRAKIDNATRDNIEQRLYYVDSIHHKMRLLDHILENTEIEQAIVFTSTINLANEIADHLREKGHHSGALHGDMSQRERTRTINQLRKGIIHILVATDVAARGIDVASLSHVINVDLPYQPDDYVHRIGRTGRAGAKGIAITFATYREESRISKINKMMGDSINVHTIPGIEPKPQSSSREQPGNGRRRNNNRSYPSSGKPGRFSSESARRNPNKPRSNWKKPAKAL